MSELIDHMIKSLSEDVIKENPGYKYYACDFVMKDGQWVCVCEFVHKDSDRLSFIDPGPLNPSMHL